MDLYTTYAADMTETDAKGRVAKIVAPAVPVHLDRHAHLDPEDGCWLMEWVARRAGEPFTDHPRCTHPLVAEIARTVNDALDDSRRQQLASRVDRLAHAHPERTRQTSAAVVAAV